MKKTNFDERNPVIAKTTGLKSHNNKPIDVSGIIKKCLALTENSKKINRNKLSKDKLAGDNFKISLKQISHNDVKVPDGSKNYPIAKKPTHISFTDSLMHKLLNRKLIAPNTQRTMLNKKRMNTSYTKPSCTSTSNKLAAMSKSIYKTPEDTKKVVVCRSSFMPQIDEEPKVILTEKKERFLIDYLKYNKYGPKDIAIKNDRSYSKGVSDAEDIHGFKFGLYDYSSHLYKDRHNHSLSHNQEMKYTSLHREKSSTQERVKNKSILQKKVDKSEFSNNLMIKNMKELENGGNLYMINDNKSKTRYLSENKANREFELKAVTLGILSSPNNKIKTNTPYDVRRLDNTYISKNSTQSHKKQTNISSFIEKPKQNALKKFGKLVSKNKTQAQPASKREPNSLTKSGTKKKLLSENPEKRLSLEKKSSSVANVHNAICETDYKNKDKLVNLNIITMTPENLRTSEANVIISNNLSSKLSLEDHKKINEHLRRPQDSAFNLSDSLHSTRNIKSILNSRNSKAMDIQSCHKHELSDIDDDDMDMSQSRSAHTFDSHKTKAVKLSRDMASLKAELIKKIKRTIIETQTIPRTSLDFYHISKLLGEGSYGKVYLGTSILSSTTVAIKCYDKTKIKNDTNFKRILQEIEIMKELSHPNIVKLYEVFENKKFIFSVLEYVDNCDLLTRLKENGIFTEQAFMPLFKQLIRALYYLQSQRILHRDIKLDNILLTKDGQAKICDFGVSQRMPLKGLVYEHIGTPAYLAPEILLKKGYNGFKADIWSLGVTSIIALTGHVPFKGDSIEELNNMIINKDVSFDENYKISNNLKRVLKGMLVKNPADRFDLQDIAGILGFKLDKLPDRHTIDETTLVDKIKRFGFSTDQILTTLHEKRINHIYALFKFLQVK